MQNWILECSLPHGVEFVKLFARSPVQPIATLDQLREALGEARPPAPHRRHRDRSERNAQELANLDATVDNSRLWAMPRASPQGVRGAGQGNPQPPGSQTCPPEVNRPFRRMSSGRRGFLSLIR